MRENHLGFLAPVLLMPLLQGCPNRTEVEAYFFMNAPICGLHAGCETIGNICEKYPDLKRFGIYRVLNSGKYEFVSYCDPLIADFQSINKRDLNRMLDKYLPEPQPESTP